MGRIYQHLLSKLQIQINGFNFSVDAACVANVSYANKIARQRHYRHSYVSK